MQTLKMDFQSQSTPPVVPVMQSDAQSRFIGISLYNGGVPYEAPEGASYTVQYRGPGANNMGWYDTITLSSGTRKAVIVDSSSKNVVTLELAEQALRVNGNVFVNLCVVANTGYMLKTFPILCRVTGAAFPDTVAVQSFFYVTGITSEQWLAYVTACQDAQKRAEDAAATFKTDPTLSVSGKAADAAKVGEAVGQVKEDLSDLFICTEEDNNLFNLMRKLDVKFVQGNFESTGETEDAWWCKMEEPIGGENLYIVANKNVKYFIAKYSATTGNFMGYVDNGTEYKTGNYALPFIYNVNYRIRVRQVKDGQKITPENCGIKIYTTEYESVNGYILANEQCIRKEIKNIHTDNDYYGAQGMCILNRIAYAIRVGSDNSVSKIIAYDIENDVLVGESFVNVGHGNSLATDGTYLFCCSSGSIYKFSVSSYLLTLEETYDVSSHRFIAITYTKNAFILLDSLENALYRTVDFLNFHKVSKVYSRTRKGEIQASKQSIAFDGTYLYVIITEWDYAFIYKYTDHYRGVCLYCLNTKRYYETEALSFYNNKIYAMEQTMNKDGKCFLNILSTIEEYLELVN